MVEYFKIFCFLVCFALSATAYGYHTRNVIILVIDGSRYSETFGDSTHQYIPRMWNDLGPQGTIYTRFYNDGVTSTCPGHGTIITGVWQNISNDGYTPLNSPTMFEFYRKKYNAPANECFVILGKPKLDILTSSTNQGFGEIYGASAKYCDDYTNDINTWKNIQEVLTTYHPRLAIVNLGQVDALGHSGNWMGYLSSIRQADSIVALTWNLLQSDSFYKDSTTLIVVNDHGRHTQEFSSHGDTCEGCRHIMCMMIGPETKAGVIDSTYHQQIDIAPTVGMLLGFSTPTATGKSLVPVRAPSVPILQFPENGAIDQSQTPLLQWLQSDSIVSSFHVQVAQSPDFLAPVIDDSSMTESYKINSKFLFAGNEYFWRVNTKNQGGVSDWSQIFRFSTAMAVFPQMILLSPQNGATVSCDSVLLVWERSNVQKYHLEIATDPHMNRIVFSDSSMVETHRIYHIVFTGSYWWRIRGYTPHGWTDWCELRFFDVEFPSITPDSDAFSFVPKRIITNQKMACINYRLNSNTAVTITISDLMGRCVQSLRQPYQKKGVYKIRVDTSRLPDGCFILNVIYNNSIKR